MSANKSAVRRLSLLAGSSLVAAGLMALAAPTAALAANECGDPSANGTTADTFVCAGTLPSITYAATNGNLTLQFPGLVTVTGGVLVTPTGANTVTLTRPTNNSGPVGDPMISNSAGAAINVERTTGGAVTLTLNDSNDVADTPMVVRGTTAGIRVRNAGTAATNVTVGRGNNDQSNATVSATAGAGIDVATIGTGGITIDTGAVVTGTTAAISVASGNTVTVNNRGLSALAAGGRLLGVVTLNNTGNTTFTNAGTWEFTGASTLRNTATLTGVATLTNNFIIAAKGAAASIDFGQATGTFNQAAYLVAGATPGASTLTLTGVDAWNNSGLVFFGQGEMLQTDGETNDRVVMTNGTAGTFTGSGSSLLVMDVDFTASQASCAAAVTADCLDLRGHNTAGTTAILVNPVATGFTAERIVLVDVAGAGTDAGVFHVSDQSPGYRAFGDGMVDAGLFLYEITNDTAAKQHVLTVAAVDGEAVELNLAGRAALASWETATSGWFDRQTDLRASLRDGGAAPGAWLRVAGAYANQDMVSTLAVGPDTVDVLTSHTQDTLALVGGVDLVGSVDGASGWVAGVTFGQVNSELSFKESPNSLEFDGYSLGAYASYVGPAFFVDAIVNTTRLDAAYKGASLGMDLAGDAESLGSRVEGGWRFDWGEGVYFEPLAALSYVRTDLGDMPVAPGVAAQFDDMTSLRGSLGARLSGGVDFQSVRVQLAGTGRVWQEFDGEAASRITTGFGDFEFLDVPEDTTGEAGVSLGVVGMGGRLSAQVSSSVKFRSSYQSVDVALGARYQW